MKLLTLLAVALIGIASNAQEAMSFVDAKSGTNYAVLAQTRPASQPEEPE